MADGARHGIKRGMELLVQDPASGSEFLLRLPVVCAELEDEEF